MPPLAAESGTVVCLASGPSLTAEDVASVRGRAVVVAVNDAVRLAPWADVIYSSDRGWWLSHRGDMDTLPGLKVTIHPSLFRPTSHPIDGKHCQACGMRLPADRRCRCAGLITFRNAGPTGLSTDPGALVNAKNSGAAAINLAVHLGARRIVLLGYDMGPDPRGRRHFYDTAPVAIRSPFAQFRKLTGTMAAPLARLDIQVINCSRETALDCFPCRPLSEVLC